MSIAGARTEASIDTALNTILAPQIANQINRSCPLAQVLRVVPSIGKNIAWDVQVGDEAPGTAEIAEDDDVTVYNSDTKIPAVLQFAHLHDAATITQFAMDAAAIAGPEALGALFMSDMRDSVNRLAKHVNKGLHTGTGAADNICGLLSAGAIKPIADAGNYGGIDASTYTDWIGNVVDAGNGTVDLTFDMIRELRRKITSRYGKRPDVYICNPVQFDKYGALFDENRRWTQTTEIVVGGRKISLDGGYTSLSFEGTPVIWDNDCADDVFIGLVSDEVEVVVMQPAGDPMGNRAAVVNLSGTSTAENGSGQTGIIARVKKLAESGEYSRWGIFTHLQLKVRSRKATGYIKNLKNT